MSKGGKGAIGKPSGNKLMIKIDVWGQGALFAFSGLEGQTDFQSQLVGSLLGDHPGIHFLSASPFELYVDTTGVSDLIWEIVASDVIVGKALIQNEWKQIPKPRSWSRNFPFRATSPGAHTNHNRNGSK